ncbi:hypothetical protein N8I74_00125 [Chitiniphilus purpureus]|uniref:ABC transporter permease n=1 Tax=Chitiniphilus purpureus TaxID=2981137 RepID=A0ABY6DM64_9NEIS|nr:hypothetical protein [Chitiniphilus sp. CD1]UXY15457.1 hypothetical protein N8I74_00125 [Chitiniphilus sp. CD1]
MRYTVLAWYRLTRAYFLTAIGQPLSLVLLGVGQGLVLWLTYWLWFALYSADPQRAGLQFEQALLLIATAQTFFALVQTGVDYQFSWELRSGQVATYLVQPLPLALRYFAYACARALAQALPLVPVWFGFVLLAGLAPALSAWALAAMALALILVFCIDLTVGLAGLVVTDQWGITASKDTLIQFCGGALVPLAFFSPPVREALNRLPFVHAFQTPVGFVTGLAAEPVTLAWQLLWCLLAVLGMRWALRLALRRILIFGA